VRDNHRINTNSQVKRPSVLAAGCRIALGAVLAACAALAQAAGYKIVELGNLGGASASGYAINDEGTVVGSSSVVIDSVEHARATMWKNGAVIDLGSVADTESRAYAINAHDKVTGSSQIKPSVAVEKAVKWHGDTIKRLKSLGGGFSQGRGINQKGVIVGYSQTRTADLPALWDEAGVHALPTLGGDSGGALAINRSGLVVGYTQTAAEFPTEHAVLWDANRQPIDLGTLGGKNSVAFGINDAGTIVGMSDVLEKNIFHAARWDGLVAVDLGALGGPSQRSSAYGINKSGVVVGGSQDHFSNFHATVWTGSQMIDLNDHLDAAAKAAGWVLEYARGINTSGQIVCNGRNTQTDVRRAFLATPVVD
jgi:probable HAF family extracellular repeat protein